MKRTILVVLLVVLAVYSANAQENGSQGLRLDAPTYAVHGSYTVGTREFVIDPDGTQPLKITVWYPALNPGGASESVTYDFGVGDVLPPPMNTMEGHALLDAAPDISHAPYPLVVYSPGLASSRFVSLYLLEHLASWGFVVLTMDHFDTALVDYVVKDQAAFADEIFLAQTKRPLQTRRVLDYAETLTADGGDLAGIINVDKVAVVGHSLGGWNALAVAGAQMHFDMLRNWCDQGPYVSILVSLVCNMVSQGTLDDNENRLIDLARLGVQPGEQWPSLSDPRVDAIAPLAPGELWPSLSDPRVDAIVPLAPGGLLTFGEDGFQGVTVPTLILLGSADMTAVPEFNGLWAYERLGAEHKGVVVFADGGHMMFAQCNAAWESVAFQMCSDPVWDLARVHDLTNHFTTAFLLTELYNDPTAAAALAPDAVNFTGIRYETTGY